MAGGLTEDGAINDGLLRPSLPDAALGETTGVVGVPVSSVSAAGLVGVVDASGRLVGEIAGMG